VLSADTQPCSEVLHEGTEAHRTPAALPKLRDRRATAAITELAGRNWDGCDEPMSFIVPSAETLEVFFLRPVASFSALRIVLNFSTMNNFIFVLTLLDCGVT
jgi:hypothetical protein